MALTIAEKQKRANYIQKTLNSLYPDPTPPLFHQDPFTLLVAVLLSAQMTDAGVNKATPALFKKAPTPKKMANLSIEEILSFIKTINFINITNYYWMIYFRVTTRTTTFFFIITI